MNSGRKIVVAIACIGVMVGSVGCASKSVVKKDETIAGKESAAKSTVAPPSTVVPPVQKKDTAPAVPVASGAAKMTYPQHTGKAITAEATFDKIYFDFDSSDLSKSSRDTLTRSAEALINNQKNAKVRIEGNCDERGSAEYNLALGERRAKAAAQYLTTMGVQPERVSVISYGNEKPAVQGNDEAAWSKNRRDEFVIQK